MSRALLPASAAEVLRAPVPAVSLEHPTDAGRSAQPIGRLAQLAAARRNRLMPLLPPHPHPHLKAATRVARFAFADTSGGFSAVDVALDAGADPTAPTRTSVTTLTAPLPLPSARGGAVTLSEGEGVAPSIVAFQPVVDAETNPGGVDSAPVHVASSGRGDLALGAVRRQSGKGNEGEGNVWVWEAVEPQPVFPADGASAGEGAARTTTEARAFILEAASPLPGGRVALLLWAVRGATSERADTDRTSAGCARRGNAGGSSAVELFRAILTRRDDAGHAVSHGGEEPSFTTDVHRQTASLRMTWRPDLVERVAEGTAPPLWSAVASGPPHRACGPTARAPEFVVAMEMSRGAPPDAAAEDRSADRLDVSTRDPGWGAEDDEDAVDERGGMVSWAGGTGGALSGSGTAPLSLCGASLGGYGFDEEEDEDGADEDGDGRNPFDGSSMDGPLEVFSFSAVPETEDVAVTAGDAAVSTRVIRPWASLGHRGMKPLAGVFVPPSSPTTYEDTYDGARVLGCLGVSHGVHCLVAAVTATPATHSVGIGADDEPHKKGAGGAGDVSCGRLRCPVEIDVAHVGAMQAFSYVAKGKPNRRFVLVTPDGTCGAVVETRRTSFVYSTSAPSDLFAAGADGGAHVASTSTPASSGLHQILDLSAVGLAEESVLGARLVVSDQPVEGDDGRRATLVLLLRSAVVTQGVRAVVQG